MAADAGPRPVLRLAALAGIPEVTAGVDLAGLIGDALEADAPLGTQGGVIQDGDILVVTSKIVSKAEGRIVSATDREDAITAETVRVVASRRHENGVTRIVENRQGLVLAAAGVDASNTPEGTVLLLPEDPDASARALAGALRARFGVRVGVIISDTLGRPWRIGQTDAAIGAAGVKVVDDLRGGTDSHGRPLVVTMAATADELAAAADLVKGKASAMPVAIVRGLSTVVVDELDTPARQLVRTGPGDMFWLGTEEAIALGRQQAREEERKLPAFRSRVFEDIPHPDYVDVVAVPLSPAACTDVRVWARALARRSRTIPARNRSALTSTGHPGGPDDASASDPEQTEHEVVFGVNSGRWLVRYGVAVDPVSRLIRVTTAVSPVSRVGRALWSIFRQLHPTVMRAQLRAINREIGSQTRN